MATARLYMRNGAIRWNWINYFHNNRLGVAFIALALLSLWLVRECDERLPLVTAVRECDRERGRAQPDHDSTCGKTVFARRGCLRQILNGLRLARRGLVLAQMGVRKANLDDTCPQLA